MIKVIIALTLVALTSQVVFSIEASNPKCAKGPNYWCKSIPNANECGAFKHCLQTVWSKHTNYFKVISTIDLTKTDKCTNCIKCLFTDLDNCESTSTYQDQIKQLFLFEIPNKSVCKLLNECDDANEETVQQDLTPKDEEISFEIKDIKPDLRFECGLHPRFWCTDLTTIRQCNAMEYCMHNWKSNGLRYTPKTLKTDGVSDVKQVNSQKLCSLCTLIFDKIHTILEENTTETEVKDYLEGYCSLLPSKDDIDQCVKIFDEYLPEIYNMVRNSVDSGVICRVLRACSDKNLQLVNHHDTVQKMSLEIPKLKQIKIKVLNPEQAKIRTPLQKYKVDFERSQFEATRGAGCGLCTIVFSAAKYLVQNKVEDEKILGFIKNQLCSRLGALNETCVDYVREEGEVLLELLAREIDPSLICHSMGLCSQAQVADINTEREEPKFFDCDVRNSMNCTLCKIVFQDVKNMMQNSKSQAEIIDYINTRLCDKIGNKKEFCKTLISSYAPEILAALAQDVHPGQLCDMLGMCVKPKPKFSVLSSTSHLKGKHEIHTAYKTTEELAKPKVTSDANCILCEFAMKMLENYVKENTSEAEIEKALHYLCSRMPQSIRPQCTQFVDTYGPIIIELLVKQVKPEQVCQEMGLCPTAAVNFRKHTVPLEISTRTTEDIFKEEESLFISRSKEMVLNNKINISSFIDAHNLNCPICVFIIDQLGSEIESDRTESALTFALANICKLNPLNENISHQFKTTCDFMSENYRTKLFVYMTNNMGPLNVCRTIKMCDITVTLDQISEKPKEKPQQALAEEKEKPMVDLVPAVNKAETTTTSITFPEFKTTVSNETLQCSLCLYVGELVDNLLKQNKTEQEIISELKLVCNLFPKSLSDQCSAFIDEYAPYVIQLIASDVTPQMACTNLKLCEATNKLKSNRAAKKNSAFNKQKWRF